MQLFYRTAGIRDWLIRCEPVPNAETDINTMSCGWSLNKELKKCTSSPCE
jgi:hypothetical protein